MSVMRKNDRVVREVNHIIFEEGNNNVSIGYGFVTFAGAVFNSYEDQNNYDFSITGPIFAKYEHAVSDHIGVGLNIAYAKWKLAYNYDDVDVNGQSVIYEESDSYSTFSILGRFNLHFGNMDKFDPYWGVESWVWCGCERFADTTSLKVGGKLREGAGGGMRPRSCHRPMDRSGQMGSDTKVNL